MKFYEMCLYWSRKCPNPREPKEHFLAKEARVKRLVQFVFLVLSLWMPVKVAADTILNPGDMLVTISSSARPDAVIHRDSSTGDLSIVSSGGFFSNPFGIALTANGAILVADRGRRAVILVDPVTGLQSIFSSGGFFSAPNGIAVEANGDILVADDGLGVIRLDRVTGDQTLVSSGGFLVRPTGIAVEANGDILVADAPNFGSGGVFRVNPVTGDQTLVSSGGFLLDPSGIAVAANGDILVASTNIPFCPLGCEDPPGNVTRLDPVTGAQTLVSTDGFFGNPFGIALEDDGDILVADPGAHLGAFLDSGGVIRVNPVTGSQRALFRDGLFQNVRSIAVVRGNVPVIGPVDDDPLVIGPVDDLPVIPDVTPIPEPATLLLVSSGLAGLGLAKRKRHPRGA